MAKLNVFECDVCKTLSKKITSVKFEIGSILLSNGENRPTQGTPVNFACEVCSDKCAIDALAKVLKKMRAEATENKNEDHLACLTEDLVLH